MLQIKKILFPTDLSECAEGAFSQAAYLASRYGAELHVLRVIHAYEQEIISMFPEFPVPDPEMAARLRTYAAEAWADSRKLHERPDVLVVQQQVEAADAVMGILEYADSHAIDLIVMATHGRRGVDHLLLGSVTEEVARLAHSPVFTLRADQATKPPQAIQHILVPVDYSENAQVAITYARELAADYGARMDVLHVIEQIVPPLAYGLEPVVIATPEVQENAQAALASMVKKAKGAEVPMATHVEVGYAPSTILDFAEEHATDLIVLATHGRTGLRRLLMGSVAEKIIRMAPCPVFTVKTFGKSLIDVPEETATHA